MKQNEMDWGRGRGEA